MNIQESQQFRELILRVSALELAVQALELEYLRLKSLLDDLDHKRLPEAPRWQLAGHKKPGPKPKHGN